MPFIKLRTPDGSIKLLNTDTIREAEYSEKDDTLKVSVGCNGSDVHYLHGREAREAYDKLKDL